MCAVILIALSWLSPGLAQCPTSITATVATTAANCPSTGTATITSNASAEPSTLYTLISGPSQAPLNIPQSGNVFASLPAGIIQ